MASVHASFYAKMRGCEFEHDICYWRYIGIVSILLIGMP